MLHRRTGRERLGKSREIRGGRPAARGVADVLTEQSHGENAPPPAAAYPACRMQREHVEAHHIPRLELPAEDAEGGAVGLDVGKISETALGKPARLGIAERAGH